MAVPDGAFCCLIVCNQYVYFIPGMVEFKMHKMASIRAVRLFRGAGDV